MHQGNLLIQKDGTIVGIDFGITGRLDSDSRRFLAEILHGFITRDYRKVARVHLEAGYVPKRHSVEDFAQALRSIGEPIRDLDASEISMSRLLTQLFDVTDQFDMATQPQLLLLQKTMVTVEGVARSFDPALNIWDAAEPVVSTWIRKQLGPEAVIRDIAEAARPACRPHSACRKLWHNWSVRARRSKIWQVAKPTRRPKTKRLPRALSGWPCHSRASHSCYTSGNPETTKFYGKNFQVR